MSQKVPAQTRGKSSHHQRRHQRPLIALPLAYRTPGHGGVSTDLFISQSNLRAINLALLWPILPRGYRVDSFGPSRSGVRVRTLEDRSSGHCRIAVECRGHQTARLLVGKGEEVGRMMMARVAAMIGTNARGDSD